MSPYEIIGRVEVEKLKSKLYKAIEENKQDIKNSQEEIDLILELIDEFGDEEIFQSAAREALVDANKIADDGQKLIKAAELLKIFR